MIFNLDFIAPKKMEPWYELELSDHAALNENNRAAHYVSMFHSQKNDYKADIRLVLSEKDSPRGDPWALQSYMHAPSIQQALRVSAEVVIRHSSRPTEEFLVQVGDVPGRVGWGSEIINIRPVNQFRPRSRQHTGEAVPSASLPSSNKPRKLDL